MSARPDRRLRRIAASTAVAVWLVYTVTAGGAMATGDAVAMFEAARSLIDRGTLDVPAEQSTDAWRGVDGRYYTPFGVGQSLFDVPFVLAGRAITATTGVTLGGDDTVPKALVAAASTLPAAVAVAFSLLLSWRLSSSARSSVLSALVVAFGTMLWPYAKFGFNAALTTGALVAGTYGVAAGAMDRRLWAAVGGGVGLGVAMLTRHEMMIAALVCVVWLTWQVKGRADSRRLIFATALPVCAAIAVWMTLNALRFGSVWRSGHEPTFSWTGFSAFLISPSGALLLYAPPAIAGIGLIRSARQGHALSGLLILVVSALMVFYATLEDWLGTRSYGPRYLVPLVPLLVAPLAVWIAGTRTTTGRVLLCGLCLTSVLVQLPGIAVDFSRAGIDAGQPPQLVRRNDWRWAPLLINARATVPALNSSARALARNERSAQRSADRETSLTTRLPAGLDFWWVHLFQLGLPRGIAVTAAVLPLIIAAWLVRRALASATNLDREHDDRGFPA